MTCRAFIINLSHRKAVGPAISDASVRAAIGRDRAVNILKVAPRRHAVRLRPSRPIAALAARRRIALWAGARGSSTSSISPSPSGPGSSQNTLILALSRS